MVCMRGIRVPALLAALMLAVAGCGTAGGKTETGAGPGKGGSGTSAQGFPDLYGLTKDGSIAHFSNGTWTTRQPDLAPGEKLDQISWSGLPGTRPLATVRSDADNSCNPTIRRIGDDGTLSPSLAAGYLPSQSPNGNLLAYVSLGPASTTGAAPSKIKKCGEQRLIVKDLDKGTERSWRVTHSAKAPNYRYGYIETKLAWSPDSTHIVVGTQDAQLYSIDVATWTEGSTLRGEKKLRSGKRILDPIWNYATGHLFVNGTKPEGTSVVLDRVDPNNGETVSTIDTGQQSFPFGMYSSEDHSIFLQNNNGLSSEPNKQSIVDVAQDGGTSVVSASGPDLVSIG